MSTPGLSAQTPGTLDTNFNSGVPGFTIYAIADEIIDEQELLVVGGDTDLLDRLYLTGVIDINFELPDFGNGARIIYTAVPQILTGVADRDKTLVGGFFGITPTPSGNPGTGPAQNIQRLNSNGVLDTSFNPGNGANNYVTSIVPEANGSIYVGGLFDHFDKIEHHHVVRLNVDGSLDNTFSSSLQIEDAVLNIADQLDPATGLPNGQILIVGTFNSVDKTKTAKLARLNNDGSLDTTFKPVIDTRVLTVLGTPDGKIIIGGAFTSVNGTPVQNIARLNQDGSLDTTFKASVTTNPPGSPDETAVYVFKRQTDGRIYVGGNFYSVNGTRREFFARLLSDGTLDTTFDPGSNVINSVQSIAIQTNNKVVVGETVSRKINNIFPPSLVRLYSDNPPVPDVVTIEANKPNAAEAGANGLPTPGHFRVTRTGDISAPLTVFLTTGGTAVSGVDYAPLQLKKAKTTYKRTFPANFSTLGVFVDPTGDTLKTSPETVTLTLQPDQNGNTNYVLGSPTTATVNISNH